MKRRNPNPKRLHSPQQRLIAKLERNSEELYTLLNRIINIKPNTSSEEAIRNSAKNLKDNTEYTQKHFDDLILKIKDSDLENLDDMINRVLEN